MNEAIRITPHIYLAGSGEIGLSEEHDCHIYLVDAGPCWWMVDAGAGIHPEQLVETLQRIPPDGKPLTHLLLTHCHADHSGGARYLQEELGVQVIAGALTAERVCRGHDPDLALDVAREEGVYPPDYVFPVPASVEGREDGSIFALGNTIVTLLDTPGHSADATCFLVDLPEGRALFSGDTLFASGLLPLLNTFDSALSAYRESIQKLVRPSFDILCPGHGLFLLRGGDRLARRMAERLSHSIYIPPVITP